MNYNTETPNSETSIALDAQKIIQSHECITELFNSSKDGKLVIYKKYKININIFKINNMYCILLLKYHGQKIFPQLYMLYLIFVISIVM